MNKKYLIFGGLALLGIVAYGGKKGFDAYSVFQQLETRLKAIRGFKPTATGIRMRVDLEMYNPTNTPLSIATGGAILVKGVRILDKTGQEVARAALQNLQRIQIVPGGTFVLEGVEVETKFGTILNSILGGLSSNPDDYEIETELETMTGHRITV